MRLGSFFLSLVLVCAGCNRPEQSKIDTSKSTSATPVSTAGLDKSDATGAAGVTCFQCKGTGTLHCAAQGCDHGKLDCPGPCLKAYQGKWEHLEVAGHAPDELWQKFYGSDGKYTAWNQKHLGEVIEIQNGKAVNIGKCRQCGGTAKVNCATCKGAGEIVCPTCNGKKVISANLAAIGAQKARASLKKIQLKDGRTLFGKIEMQFGSKAVVRT